MTRNLLLQSMVLLLPCLATAEQPFSASQLPWPLKDTPLQQSAPRDSERAWNHLLEELWKTPLGEMYSDYLFSLVSPASMPIFAKTFVDHIFSDSNKLVIRIAALQLMTKDLYVRELMDVERQKRVLLLEGDVSARRIRSSSISSRSLSYQAAIILLACLPYGSPLIRERVGRLLDRVSAILFRRPQVAQRLASPMSSIFSFQVLRGYDFGNSMLAFMNVFGPLSTVQFLFQEWNAAISQDFREDHELLLGLDDYIHEQQL